MEDVECLSSSTYAERPLALTWQGVRREITGILAEWRTPAARHFRVKTNDGLFFELTFHESPDAGGSGSAWQIQPIPGG